MFKDVGIFAFNTVYYNFQYQNKIGSININSTSKKLKEFQSLIISITRSDTQNK